MGFPEALAGIAIGTSLLGTGASMIGQIQAAQQQAAMARYNAQLQQYQAAMQRQQADLLTSLGEMEKARREQEGQKLLSRQLSIFGASGIEPTEGSPLAVMEQTAAEIERDALLARYRYQLGAAQAGQTAELAELKGRAERFRAGAYERALPWQMGTTLLTGLSPLLDYQKVWKPLGF